MSSEQDDKLAHAKRMVRTMAAYMGPDLGGAQAVGIKELIEAGDRVLDALALTDVVLLDAARFYGQARCAVREAMLALHAPGQEQDEVYERVACRVDVEVIRTLLAHDDRFMRAALASLPLELAQLVQGIMGPQGRDGERGLHRRSSSWTQRVCAHALERVRREYLRQVAAEFEETAP